MKAARPRRAKATKIASLRICWNTLTPPTQRLYPEAAGRSTQKAPTADSAERAGGMGNLNWSPSPAPVAQRIERVPAEHEARGSTPLRRTTLDRTRNFWVGTKARLDRLAALHPSWADQDRGQGLVVLASARRDHLADFGQYLLDDLADAHWIV